MKADLEGVLAMAQERGRKKMAVTGDGDDAAVEAVIKARDMGLVDFFVCGRALAVAPNEIERSLPSADLAQARAGALGMAREGRADLVLDTGPLDQEFLALLNDKSLGVKSGLILSYVSLFSAKKDGRLTLLTDTLINGAPGIKKKVGIVNNALEVAAFLGIDQPHVAALSALELVNPAMESTLHAAALSKMSERHQFGSAIIEGPLAFDNAESASAARHKGIDSPVPGAVDIYLFPELESGNLMAQFMGWLGSGPLAGILAGVNFPVIVRSHLEGPDSWLFNIALGVLLCSGRD